MRKFPSSYVLPASVAVLLFIVSATYLIASTQTQTPQRNRLQLAVECWRQAEWRAVDPHSVFEQQDRLRFRFRSSVSAYLYILNHASGGHVYWLYPRVGRPSDRLVGGLEIIIPPEGGSYTVGGPPGLDTLYWVLRRTRLTMPDVDGKQLDEPSTLISRCREEEARKELACADNEAGPKPVTDPKKVQAALGISNSLVARDLTFELNPEETEIGTDSDGSSSGIIYQLRIAHH